MNGGILPKHEDVQNPLVEQAGVTWMVECLQSTICDDKLTYFLV